MRSGTGPKKIMSKEEVQEVFSNIEILNNIHMELFQDIQVQQYSNSIPLLTF